jgi:nucleoside-diphosphate-sugar epimerase
VFIQGSILDRPKLTEIASGCDCIVHIAAWHGIHETRGEKNSYDFFDLNVRGTFEVFEAAISIGVNKIIFISTTSVYRPDTRYGSSKILAELIAEDYGKNRNMNVITLRPRGFIPFWDRDVYASYSDWARWFWKGAVHIDDVAAAVILSLDLISRHQLTQQLILTLDSAYEYTDADLDHWDADEAGSTFKKYYPEYYDLALSYGLDPALKPTKLDISETVRWLGYKPSYSLASCYQNWQPTAITDHRSLARVLNIPRSYQADRLDRLLSRNTTDTEPTYRGDIGDASTRHLRSPVG